MPKKGQLGPMKQVPHLVEWAGGAVDKVTGKTIVNSVVCPSFGHATRFARTFLKMPGVKVTLSQVL